MLTTRRPDAPRRVGAERVESQGAEGDRRDRAEGAGAESGEPLSERGGFAGELRASIAVLDALGVAGEEEELAQTQSTSVGRVLVMAGGCCSWPPCSRWWFWWRDLTGASDRSLAGRPVADRQDLAELLRERRARQHLIDAGGARAIDGLRVDVRHVARAFRSLQRRVGLHRRDGVDRRSARC